MNAPKPIVVFVPIPVGGSVEPLRRTKPIYPTKRDAQRWPLQQQIPHRYMPPADQIAAIRRAGQELLKATRRPTT